MNQWCVEKDKNVFKLPFRFHDFPEIAEILETRTHKKFDFQHYRDTKIPQIKVFWSNREMEMSQNVVFRLNREIKMS